MLRSRSYALKRFFRFLLGLVVAIAVAVGVSFGIARGFTLTSVEVDASDMVIEVDREKIGNNLLFLRTDELKEDLLHTYPILSSVQFEKRWPHTLVVHLKTRPALAVLRTQGAYYALDTKGVVLGALTDAGSYPLIDIPVERVSIGSPVADTRVKAVVEVLTRVQDIIKISRIREGENESLKFQSDKTQFIFPLEADWQKKADTLQVIIAGFRIKSTLPAVVDLRFDKPVITN